MTLKPEQPCVGGGLANGDAAATPVLRVDPPLASSHWILVRGQVVMPSVQRPRLWWLRRRPNAPAVQPTVTELGVRLPDEDEPRRLAITPNGWFEARLPAHLPRLRAAQRQLVFTLRHADTRLEQMASLFMPQPNASLGVILLHGGAAPALVPTKRSGYAGCAGLSGVTRELTSLLSRGAGTNPIFHLAHPDGQNGVSFHAESFRPPEGLTIPVTAHPPGSAIAVAQAGWIARILELYAGELEFSIISDTDRNSVATLRALVRQSLSLRAIRAVFLSDTRPVARGVMLQADRPTGIDGLELPIVVCRTLDEARRAATVCGVVAADSKPAVEDSNHPGRRLSAAHARVTRYPLVFCHGMLGYSVIKLRPTDLENYFHGVRELLTGQGFHVLMPQLGKTHSIEQRAEQLRRTIGRWTTEPVNIIAHSMGGLDARFLISKLGMADRVTSLTTVASPHRGSYFADWFVERFDRRLPFLRGLEQFGLEVEGFRDCTRTACREFNEVVLDAPQVRYFSYSAFQVPRKIPPMLRRSHSLIARVEGPNDGLVSDASARWGEHMATLRSDHVSLIGERGVEFFDHLAFYSRIVDDLIRLGF